MLKKFMCFFCPLFDQGWSLGAPSNAHSALQNKALGSELLGQSLRIPRTEKWTKTDMRMTAFIATGLRCGGRPTQRYPPIARYGVLGVSTWPIGCDTPSPFSERSPLESMRSGGAIPPPRKG